MVETITLQEALGFSAFALLLGLITMRFRPELRRSAIVTLLVIVVGLTLIPANLLFDLGWLGGSDCAGAFHLFAARGPEKIPLHIEKIDIAGDVFGGAWRLGLRHDVGPDRDWPICPGGNGYALNLAVAGPEMTEFAWSALRSFHIGQPQTLSLSSDQP